MSVKVLAVAHQVPELLVSFLPCVLSAGLLIGPLNPTLVRYGSVDRYLVTLVLCSPAILN